MHRYFLSLFLLLSLLSFSQAQIKITPKPDSPATPVVSPPPASLPAPRADAAPVAVPQADYDVIVVGSEPEGIIAAVAAAEEGANTLLITEDPLLGGLFVMGQMNSLDLRTKPFNYQQGLFLEWWQRVGGGHSFDVKRAESVFIQMLSEAGVNLRVNAPELLPYTSGNQVLGVQVAANNGSAASNIFAPQVIDATSEMDFAAGAGAAHTFGFSSVGYDARMADTLVFRIDGIDWNALKTGIRARGKDYAVVDDHVAWGHFGGYMAAYEPLEPGLRLRGLNLGRQEDGTALVNALLIYGVNPFDEASVRDGFARAERESPRIIEYLKQDLPGFENATYGGVAPRLYIRETRHLTARCTLTVDDVLNNHVSEFDIAAGGYPLDVQTMTEYDTGYVYGKPDIYGVQPCVNVPLEVDNLWVVGKSAGYDPIAASSARVVPFGMAVGEAIGVAAATAARTAQTPAEFVYDVQQLRDLRSTLSARGAYLPKLEARSPVGPNANPYYQEYRLMLSRGLAVGGYSNDPSLDEEMKSLSYIYLLSNVGQRFWRNQTIGKDLVNAYAYSVSEGPLTPDLALRITQDTACRLGLCLEQDWEALKTYGLAPLSFPPDGTLTRGEMYALAARLAELEPTLQAREATEPAQP